MSSGVANEHWVLGEALDPGTTNPGLLHTYASAGAFTAFLADFRVQAGLGSVACCRIGGATLNNRSNGSYPIQTVVDLSGNSSPVSTMVPIVVVPPSATATFLVPAGDPDGDAITFRLADATEAGDGGAPLFRYADRVSR